MAFSSEAPGDPEPALKTAFARREDERLIRGRGRFTADHLDGACLHAVVVRSHVASGRIRHIDAATARDMPGVAAILTAADAAADGIGAIPWEVCPPGLEGEARYKGDPLIAEPQPVLAREWVRYVGEPVALVVAETFAQAEDAAEAIAVTIDDAPACVSADDALAADAAAADGERPNLVFEHRIGDAEAVAAAMASAAFTVRLRAQVPRLAPASLEPRGYVGRYEAASESWTLIASTGKPHPMRNALAAGVFGVDPSRIRLIAPDVGGGFGGKNLAYPEAALVLWAAKRLGRDVRWISGRGEAFQSDMQGRDHSIEAEMALSADGRMLAVRYDSLVNLGAYLAPRGIIPTISGLKLIAGPYRIAHAAARVRAVLTNTVPTAPYRGAGVPEVVYVVERLVDLAARRLRADPMEFRARNVVRPSDLPWTAPTGAVMHSVNFPALLERSRAQLPAGGQTSGRRRRGRGIAMAVEGYGIAFDERAELEIAEGAIELRIGTKSAGQGHETVYAEIAAAALGVAPEKIAVVQGDTGRVERGNGTAASRSLTVGGSAVCAAAAALIEAVRPHAAASLQTSPEELAFRDGRFERAGAMASIALFEAAALSPGGRVEARAAFRPTLFNWPAACHIADVDVDTETGAVRLLAFRAVHDCGIAVNPTIVTGQLQGGIAQGIGSALSEEVRWDRASGQLLAASFLDYAVPRAGDLPRLDVTLAGTSCASNPLGAKAAGEAGTVAPQAAIVNAVLDALRELGVEDLPLPLTAENVWRAIRDAGPTRRAA